MLKKSLGLGIFIVAAQGVTSVHADGHVIANPAASTIESFEAIHGVTKGKRRNHTKGYCFSATLVPHDSAIKQYSNSALFNGESVVIGRLSHKDGNNNQPDNKPHHYGMGLSVKASNGDVQLMSMNTLDFFPVATPEAFAELMHAKTKGKPFVKAFKAKNKDLQRFKAHKSEHTKTLKPYEGSIYNSVNSFYLVDASGNKTAVRWSFVPTQKQGIVVEKSAHFFYDNVIENLNENGVAWDMVITLANDDDVVDNAALPWTGKHKQILAAKLVVDSVSREADGKCDAINYDPLVLAKGFAPSADPLLQARRSAYAISFGKRIAEKAKQEEEEAGEMMFSY